MAHEKVRRFYDSLYSVNKATNLENSHGTFEVSAKGHERDLIDSSYTIDPAEEQVMYYYGSQ